MTISADFPALSCRSLRKSFGGSPAVQGLDLRVERGGIFALLGPNGAGKTTTLRMIAGLLRPDAGEISVGGVSVRQRPAEAKRSIAYIPDEPLLYGKLRPMEHLEFVGALWGMAAQDARARAEDLLRRLTLPSSGESYIETLSRGMKQKLAVAAALLHRPSLLLLDEPLTGLDAASARVTKDLLREVAQQGGAVVVTTHILDWAERWADRIGIMSGGRLVAEGSLDELRRGKRESLEEIFLDRTARAC